MSQLLGLSKMKSNTQGVPLALLGYRLQQRDFFAPLSQQLELTQKKVLYTPQDKLLTCLVSMMTGCQAICHIDTRIRPDLALAQAWGLERFAHQSTVLIPSIVLQSAMSSNYVQPSAPYTCAKVKPCTTTIPTRAC